MTINDLKALLGRFHIRPNKVLGQNFLLSEEVLDKIVAAAELTREDTVLEIGPGLGFLTTRLAEKAGRVVAVEKDRKMARVLHKVFKNYKNVKIIEGDVLFLNPSVILNSIQDPGSGFRLGGRNDKATSYKLVANIPYYLTGKILQKFLTPSSSPPISQGETGGEREGVKPSLMVLLLQKEVAERIVAGPGEMSILSVSVQFYADPEIIDHVGKENFYPVPEVDSAIVRLTPSFISPYPPSGDRGRKRGGEGVDEKKFFQLVKIGFSNRRKQLQNNLTAGLRPAVIPAQAGIHSPRSPLSRGRSRAGLDSRFRGNDKEGDGNDKSGTDYKKLLSSLGLNPLCRAQDLSLEDWKQLYEKLFTPSR